MARIRHLTTGLAAIAILTGAIASSPQVNYPLNLQLPPVARVGEQYSFQFASTTFQPNPDQLQYSLVGNPAWLHLNSSSRTLWGTPESNDVGSATFSITAAGEAGAVANMESKLLVVQDGPALVGNMSQQLSKAGQLTGPSSLTLLPSHPFEVRFDKDLFDAKGKNLSYYATSADHTPLPAWIGFNAQTLSFSGTTPLSPSPQSFNILLIASSTPEFAEASAAFTIVVSSHQLLFKPLSQTLNVSKGEKVQIDDLKKKLFLDNAPITDADIQTASAEVPSWLSFDAQSFEVAGVPPSGLMAQDLSITVMDKYGDTAKHDIQIFFTSKLFTAGIEQLNITAGEPFEYTIPRSILAQDGERVILNMRGLEQWLKFDPDTLGIRGTIPDGAVPRDAEISMTATTGDGASQDSQTIPVRILAQTGSAGSENNSNSRGSEVADSTQRTPPWNRKRAGIIAGSVISAAVLSIIVLALIRCLLRRRKKYAKGYISPRAPRSPRKSEISRPLPPIVEEWGKVDMAHDADLEKGKDEENAPKRTLEPPPRLNLNLPSKEIKHHSATSSLDEPGDRIFSDFTSSPYGLQDESGPSRCPHDSMRTPTKILRTEPNLSPDKERAYRDAECQSPSSSVQRRQRSIRRIPTRHAYSSSGGTNITSRRRRSAKSGSSATSSLSMASTVATAIPQQHKARHTTLLTTPLDKRPSIRSIVPETSTVCTLPPQSSTSEKRISWTERRNTYFKDRASSQKSLSFFGGGATRGTSGSYSKPPAFITQATTSTTETPPQAMSDNIVKPGDDPATNLRESVKIRRPFETPSPQSKSGKFPATLRKQRSSLIRRHTEDLASKKQDLRPSPERGQHTSVPNPRARRLKSGLNESTQEQIYEDSDISVSEYSDEEDTIESYNNRGTITQADFIVRPLNPAKKRNTQSSNKELKRTSEREATPYFATPFEHGGKENDSPSHDSARKQATSHRESPMRYSGSVITTRVLDSPTHSPSPSPSHRRRPKTATGLRVRTPSNGSGSRARRRPLSQTHVRASSPRSRRPTSQLSDSQSTTSKKPPLSSSLSLMRSQSSAFPHFGAKKRSSRASHHHHRPSDSRADTIDPKRASHRTSRRSQSTQLEDVPHDRDVSGNLIMRPASPDYPSSYSSPPPPPPPPPPEKNPRRTTAPPAPQPSKADKKKQDDTRTKRRSHNNHAPAAAAAASSHPFYQANRRGAYARGSMLSPFPSSSLTQERSAASVQEEQKKKEKMRDYADEVDPPHAPLPMPPPTIVRGRGGAEGGSWLGGLGFGVDDEDGDRERESLAEEGGGGGGFWRWGEKAFM